MFACPLECPVRPVVVLRTWSWSGVIGVHKFQTVQNHVTVASEPERIGVFLTRSCVHVTDISCGVVYKATLASLVLFRSYCYVERGSQARQAARQKSLNLTFGPLAFLVLTFSSSFVPTAWSWNPWNPTRAPRTQGNV